MQRARRHIAATFAMHCPAHSRFPDDPDAARAPADKARLRRRTARPGGAARPVPGSVARSSVATLMDILSGDVHIITNRNLTAFDDETVQSELAFEAVIDALRDLLVLSLCVGIKRCHDAA